MRPELNPVQNTERLPVAVFQISEHSRRAINWPAELEAYQLRAGVQHQTAHMMNMMMAPARPVSFRDLSGSRTGLKLRKQARKGAEVWRCDPIENCGQHG